MAFMSTHTCTQTHTHTLTLTCTCTHTHACMQAHTCAHTHACMHAHTRTHTHTHKVPGNPVILTFTSLCDSHACCCFGQVQNKALEGEEIDQIMRKVQNLKKKEADFSVACPRCYKVKVNGAQIRKVNNAHHVIIGHDIDSQVIKKPGKTIMKMDDWEMKGSVICTCKNLLGQMLIYKKVGCMGTLLLYIFIAQGEAVITG